MVFPTDPKAIAAGSKNFDKFGLINIADSLAGGDVLKWKDVMQLDNATVMLKMAMNATKAEFEERYTKLCQNS